MDIQKIETDFVWCEHFKLNFGITKGYLETVSSKENYDQSYSSCYLYLLWFYKITVIKKVAGGRIMNGRMKLIMTIQKIEYSQPNDC